MARASDARLIDTRCRGIPLSEWIACLDGVSGAPHVQRPAHAHAREHHTSLIYAGNGAAPLTLIATCLKAISRALGLEGSADAGTGSRDTRLVRAKRRERPLTLIGACPQARPKTPRGGRGALANAHASDASLVRACIHGRSRYEVDAARDPVLAAANDIARNCGGALGDDGLARASPGARGRVAQCSRGARAVRDPFRPIANELPRLCVTETRAASCPSARLVVGRDGSPVARRAVHATVAGIGRCPTVGRVRSTRSRRSGGPRGSACCGAARARGSSASSAARTRIRRAHEIRHARAAAARVSDVAVHSCRTRGKAQTCHRCGSIHACGRARDRRCARRRCTEALALGSSGARKRTGAANALEIAARGVRFACLQPMRLAAGIAAGAFACRHRQRRGD